jgi:para-nitrobenzyl esterase
VQGVASDGFIHFKGIPYAQPPVGPLRWSPPEPAPAWEGVLDASAYRSICPQPERYGIKESSLNEDCLHLNVTVPAGEAQAPRPVIVWIHGGAFVGGSSALYDLEELARTGDAVVVSMNYRVGVFGVMAHPGFAPDSNGGYGLLDQREALRWVQRNIAAFGGDPDNVTLAGESAGGAGVCMHLLAPEQTQGLFHKAIVMSAGCVTPLPTVEAAMEIGNQVAKLVGCETGTEGLECLRSKPVKDLLDAGTVVAGDSILTFMPNVGTDTVPLPGAQAFPAGKFVQVPVIMGGTRDELRLYVAYAVQAGQKIDAENYADLLLDTYGDHAERIIARYPLSNYSSAATALGSVWSDFRSDVGINHCIYLETAKLARAHAPVYQFVFSDRDAPPVTANPGFEMGAVHSSELPYLFPGYDNTREMAGPELAPASKALAQQMLEYFTSFARTGKPEASGAPVWEPYIQEDRVLNLEPGKTGYFNASEAAQCDFWKTLYPEVLTQ